MFVNDNGIWKETQNSFVLDDSIWKENQKEFVQDGGIWKEVSGGTPPVPVIPPILWNKLGSESEITTSEYGPNGSTYYLSAYPAYDTGKFGDASKFNEGATVNQGIQFVMPWGDRNEKKWGEQELTVEFWTKPLDTNSESVDRVLFSLGRSTYSHVISVWHRLNVLRVNSINGSTGRDVAHTWSTTEWVHIAISVSTTEIKLYIDGVDTKTWSIQATSLDQYLPNEFYLGAWSDVSKLIYPYKGYIDNVKIYDYAKTDFSDRDTEGI